ncbi:MAG: PaaI family thioesterase [Hyphomicrobiales bacterium]|nr:PaaI family thioesterase [Hyphomicrobiales bacterium]MBV8826742.1 PaaI family thioesterase [Hyphomicrobiales bacterium]
MADASQAVAPEAHEVNPRAHARSAVADTLGLTFTHLSRDRVSAELPARAELANRKNILSGGVLMALADILGGTAASANLPPGAGTTTIESKTNFFAPVELGDTVFAECTPLHRGRTTMVWQTRITRRDGKLVAMVTQTQLVMAVQTQPS